MNRAPTRGEEPKQEYRWRPEGRRYKRAGWKPALQNKTQGTAEGRDESRPYKGEEPKQEYRWRPEGRRYKRAGWKPALQNKTEDGGGTR